jgi:K+-sensing histidine kinase KdpD
MKTSVSAHNFLDDNRLVEDIFHELKSIVASILSSVELIALYDGKSTEGKITRQAEAIKSQVIELDFQLQNVRIIQQILSKSFKLKKKSSNLQFFLNQLVREEPYTQLLTPAVELPASKTPTEAHVDEAILRQLILNLYFWMNRHSTTHTRPRLVFSFEQGYFEIRGTFYANYIFTSPNRGENDLLHQPICYMMSYLSALHDGTFEILAEPEKNVVVLVKIPKP